MWQIIKNPYSEYSKLDSKRRLKDAVFVAQRELSTNNRPTKDGSGSYVLKNDQGKTIFITRDPDLYGYEF